MISEGLYGFVWKCWVNIPNEIAIFHRDNDQQNHWVQWGTRHFQTHPFDMIKLRRVGWVTISYHLFPVIGVDAHNIGINMYLAIAIMDD